MVHKIPPWSAVIPIHRNEGDPSPQILILQTMIINQIPPNPLQNVKDYCFALGHFWQNFNNLELFLRLYLNQKNGKDNIYGYSFLELPIKTECEENPMTDWKTFGELCKLFNSYQDTNNKIDFTEIVELRDAMAHGRVTGDSEANMYVIKYSKPKGNKVIVEYTRKINLDELNKITDKIGELGKEISLRWGAKML
jgi:hypothetical protein